MSRLRLTLALGDYDHTRDVAHGVVRPEGIDLNWIHLPVEEIFHRFLKYREWDVSELSFGKYVSLVAQEDRSLVALPVFPSRVFRHSSIYVRPDGPVRVPADLAGKRIGIPEWAQTASIYTRGFIAHELGIPLTEVDWVQAGVNEPGRAEKVALELPPGVRYRAEPQRSLNEMLLAGELDAVLSARPPRGFDAGRLARLYPDYRAAEEGYYRKAGIFPIMHVLALRREIFDANPWVAMNLLKAFEEAKRRSLARLGEITASHAPLAWIGDHVQRMRALFGDDPWPYGIEPNRPTLEAFVRFAHEQGVCRRAVAVEELFPAEVRTTFKV